MYNDFFYDQDCSIYSISDTIINGAEKREKTVLYENIKCALWSIDWSNAKDWSIGRQHDTATHSINLDWQYTGVEIWAVCIINNREYIVVDHVTYTDIDNTIDNTSLYVRVR